MNRNDRTLGNPGTPAPRRAPRSVLAARLPIALSLSLSLVLVTSPEIHAAVARDDTLNYMQHVEPILRNRCVKCHNADTSRGGVDVSSFRALLAGGSGGDLVEAGEPDASPLYLVVAHLAEPKMPYQQSKLPDREIEVLRGWIEQGLRETANDKARAKKRPRADLQFRPPTGAEPEGPPPMPEHVPLEPVVVTSRAGALAALASSPWAPLVALGGQRQVLLYNVETLELVGVLPFPEGQPESVTFHPDGSLLTVGGGRPGAHGVAAVFDVESGRRITTLGDEPDMVLCADLSADRTRLALGGPSKLVQVFATDHGEPVHSIKKHTDWLTALSFSPDGVLLATGDRSGGLQVWEAHSGQEFYSLSGHSGAITSLSWRADSNLLASASEDGTVRLWEMTKGRQTESIRAHAGGVLSVHFGRDGRLVTAGRDHEVRVFGADGKPVKNLTVPRLDDVATGAVFSHDQTRLVAGDWTGTVRVFDAEGRGIGTLSGNPPSLATRLRAARAKLAELQPLLADQQAQLEVARAAAQEPIAARDSARENAARLAAVLAACEERWSAARTQLDSMQQAQDQLRAEVQARQQALVELGRQEQEARAEAGAAAEAQQAHAEAIVQREALAAQLSDAADQAREQSSGSPEEAVLQALAAAAEAAARAAHDAVQASRDAQARATSDADEWNRRAEQASQQRLHDAAWITDAGQRVERNEEELGALRDAERQAHAARDAAVAEATPAGAEAERLNTLAAPHEQALLAARDQCRATQAAVQDASRDVARWTAELLNARAATLRDVVEACQAVADDWDDQVAEAEAQQARAEAAVHEAEQVVASMPARLAAADQAILDAQERQRAAEEAITRAEAVVAERQAFRDSIAASLAPVHERAAAREGDDLLASAVREVGELLATLDQDVATARGQVEERVAAHDAARKAVAAATERRAVVQAAAEAAPARVTDTQAAATTARHDLAYLRAMQRTARCQVEEARRRLQALLEEYRRTLPADVSAG